MVFRSSLATSEGSGVCVLPRIDALSSNHVMAD